jgi:hypothetical protein
MQQSKVTFVIREDLLAQAQVESEASTLAMAELLRRAIDLYLTQFYPPEEYDLKAVYPPDGFTLNEENLTRANLTVKKYPIHINDGLLGELDRYAMLMEQSSDEVVNRALVLYAACLQERRRAAEGFEALPVSADAGPGEEIESLPEDDVVEPDPDEPDEVDDDDFETSDVDEAEYVS